MHLKDELMPRYAELIYNGFWFSPEREMLQAAIDHSQEQVTGTVRMKLYKGNVTVIGRESPLLALRPGAGHLRGRQRRLRPARRRGLHQAQCAPAADIGAASAAVILTVIPALSRDRLFFHRRKGRQARIRSGVTS